MVVKNAMIGFTYLLVCSQVWASPISKQSFETPQTAVNFLIMALEHENRNLLLAAFGPAGREMIDSTDAVVDRQRFERFLRHYRERSEIVSRDENTVALLIGENRWPFPVPLVRKTAVWQFDTEAGKEEILDRRIGHNELKAVRTLRALVDAQRLYAAKDRDDDGSIEFAQLIISSPQRKDGLFWEARENEAPSPLGPDVAQALSEGYKLPGASGHNPRSYYGYQFRVLTAQGADARGGKRSYLNSGGSMDGGFAFLAYPVKWGISGVISFIVSADGQIFEKDLGPQTGTLAPEISAYNPDKSWQMAEGS